MPILGGVAPWCCWESSFAPKVAEQQRFPSCSSPRSGQSFLPGAESQVAKTTIDLTDSIDVAFEFCIFVGHRAHPVIGSNLMMTHVNTCNMGPNPSWSKEARPLFADRESLDNFLAARAMVAGEASLPWGSGCWMAETVSTDHMPMVAGDILFN